MTKIKALFNTPKKTLISIACIIAALAVIGVCSVFAAQAIAESSSIGAENAQNFAFADAGVDPAAATNVRTEFEFALGQFVYEVEFTADGTEYDYLISASDGTVVKKESEVIDSYVTSQSYTSDTDIISSDNAVSIALEDAGETTSSATVTKTKLDYEDGIRIYDVEFYTSSREYEYEINAATGEIVSKSSEPLDNLTSTSSNSTSTTTVTLDNAKSIALADAGLSESSVTFTKQKLDTDNGEQVYDIEFYTSSHEYEYEINAATGEIVSKSIELIRMGNTSSGTSVTLDEAVSIALADAGESESSVTFTKQKLDTDDGEQVYDIEFYTSSHEYEYEIGAATGDIYSKSVDALTVTRTSTNTNTTNNTSSTPSAADNKTDTNSTNTSTSSTTSSKAATSSASASSTATSSKSATSSASTSSAAVSSKAATSSANTSSAATSSASSIITLDEAKSIALADAGESESTVTFTKQKLDRDDGVQVYEIDFYTSTKEYEYEINATTGRITDKDVETIRTASTSTNTSSTTSTATTSSGYITLDEAKEIAAQKAGYTADEVTFKKAKLDHDDGQTLYEIEFVKNGMEYECEIDAATGKILDYECERDD